MTGIGNNFQIASLSNCFVIGNGTCRFLRWDHENRPGTGSVNETPRRRWSRLVAHPSQGNTCEKQCPHLYRGCAIYGTLFKFNPRSCTGWPSWCANAQISIKHPDAEKFIDAKMEEGKVTGANVSVKINDEFMNAVVNNEKYIQQYPIDSTTRFLPERLMPANYGGKSYIMHGNQLNPAFCSGIQ